MAIGGIPVLVFLGAAVGTDGAQPPTAVWLRDPHFEPMPAAVLQVLDTAHSVTVYAISPMTQTTERLAEATEAVRRRRMGEPSTATPPARYKPGEPKPELFHDYAVIGKVAVADPEVRREVTLAVRQALVGSGGVAGCFNPRHGVRAEAAGQAMDLVICFQCNMTSVYLHDDMSGKVISDDSARAVLNRVLEKGGVTPLKEP